MDDRSQYLAAALQSMGAPPPQQAAPQGLSLQQMQGIAKQKAAFEAANPGQSYMGHGLQQMGQNIANAPGALAAAPGNAMSGFQKLIQGLPGFGGGQSQQGGLPPVPRGADGQPLLGPLSGL